MKEGHFTPGENGRLDGKHSRLPRSWQVAFKSKPIPALPRCPSNKINTSLLMHRFHLPLFLVCSFTDYGECPCMGELSCTCMKCMYIVIVMFNRLSSVFKCTLTCSMLLYACRRPRSPLLTSYPSCCLESVLSRPLSTERFPRPCTASITTRKTSQLWSI